MVLRNAAVALLIVCCSGLAQDAQQQKDSSQKKQDTTKEQKEAPPPKKEEPAPLFGGKLGTHSSEKKKESATLGFNGIDPSGKVSDKVLATTPTADHQAKVKKMAELAPAPADLDAFVKEGGLNKR